MYQLIRSAATPRERRSRFLAKARRHYAAARVARARLYILVSAFASVMLLAAIPAPDAIHAMLAQVQTHPVVETLWPTSITGWLGIVMSTVAFIGVIKHAITKPGEAAAKAVEDRIEVKLDKLTESLRVMSVDNERTTKSLTDAFTMERTAHQIRVDDMHRGFAERDARLRELDINWTQSREDRRHLAQNVTELKSSIVEWRKEETTRFDKMFDVLLEALRHAKTT